MKPMCAVPAFAVALACADLSMAAVALTDQTNVTLAASQVEEGGDASDNPDVTGGAGGLLVPFTESGTNGYDCCGGRDGTYGIGNLNDGDVGVGVPSDGTYAIPTSGPGAIEITFTGGSTTITGIAIYNGYGNRDDGDYLLKDGAGATLGGWTISGTGGASNAGMDSLWLTFNTPVTTDRLVIDTSVGDCCGTPSFREIQVFAAIGAAPSITEHPLGGTATEGDDFTLSVVAERAGSYQWKKGGTDVPGATGSDLVLSNLKLSDAGDYTVVVSNPKGSVTSNPATLRVNAAPTFPSYTAAVLADGPIHYFPLDETTGTAAADVGTLAAAPGLFTGGITLGQASASPRLGKCAKFDGQPGTLVDLGLFHPGNDFSVEAWALLDPGAVNNPQYHAIVARWDGSYELDFAPGDIPNLVVKNDTNTFGVAAGGAAAPRGLWHHLVGVFSGGFVTVYVDGIKGTEQNIGGALQDAGPAPDRVMIGATRSGTEASFNFRGNIDEVAFYDRALTASQIRSHLRAATSGDAPPPLDIAPAVLLTWPTFPSGYLLQRSADLVTWQPVTDVPVVVDGLNRVTVVQDGTAKFFRLVKP